MFFLIFRFFDRNALKLILANVLLGVLPVASVYLFTNIVEVVTEHKSLNTFILYSALLVASMIISPITNDYIKILLLKLNQNIKSDFVTKLNDYYAKQDFLYLQSAKFQNRVSLVEGFDQDVVNLYQTIFSVIKNLITLSGTIFLIINLNIWIVVSVFIASIVSIAINRYIGKLQFDQTIELLDDTRLNEKLLYELKYSKNQSQIFLSNIFGDLFNKWIIHYRKINSLKIKQMKKISVFNVSAEMVMTLSFIFICFLIWRAATFSAAKIVLVLQSMSNFQSSISQLGDNYVELREFRNKTNYIQDFMKYLRATGTFEETDCSIQNKLNMKFDNFVDSIHLEKLFFKFPEKEILKITSPIIFDSEQIIRIQGRNGEGKSTFLNCLTGVYDSDIKIKINDSYYLEQNQVKDFMKQNASILHQWNLKVVGDFKNNLFIRKVDLENSDYCLVNNFYNQFYKDFDRTLDLEFENGIELSGGQWQLLFLVRTLLKDSKFFVFDEPSNHLDDQKIEMLKKDLLLLKKRGKIVLLITHDPRLKDLTPCYYELRDKKMNLITSEVSVF